MAIIKKIREKLGKIIEEKRNKRRLRNANKAPVETTEPQRTKETPIGMQETVIGQTKFSHPETARMPRVMTEELPSGYNKDKILLQVRDPWWIHAYWEITGSTLGSLKYRLGDSFYSAKKILRVYDVSHIIFNGRNAHRFFDIETGIDVNNWYIDTASPGRSWCVDIGLRLANGDFILIARSNTVSTPLDGPSWITDEEWMIPEDMFARLYGMGFGFGRSSPVGKAWQERLKRELFSGVLASPGITSVSSPAKKAQMRKFWLIVNTELIVYGATEPDARVTVGGREIKLRPDGTFSLRFALPDGKQVIPVKAVSGDRVEERTITPIVTKDTK